MRRILRPIVISIATLGLALGAGVGLAAPALADDASFTASITSDLPIMSGASYTLVFGGEKTTDSSITSVELDNPDSEDLASDSSACTGLAAGTPPDGPGTGTMAWSCSFEPEGGFVAGSAFNIKIVEENADGTVDQHFLSYDVIDSDDPPSPPPATSTDGNTGYVNRTYAFNPTTGVTVSGTPTAGGAFAGLEVETVGEGNSLYADCATPGVDDDGDPLDGINDRFSGVSAGTNSCTTSLDGPQDSEGADFYSQLFEVESVEGNSDRTPLNGTTGEYFTVFASPTISTAVAAGGTQVLVSGVGAIFGTEAPVDVFDGNGTFLCEATPADDDAGDWNCTTPDLGIGTHQLFAAIKDLGAGNDYCEGPCVDDAYYVLGAYSELSAPLTAIFTSPAPTTGGIGTTDTTPDWSFTIGGDLTNIHPGDTLDISGSGLPAGTSLDTILHSVPTDLGTVVAAADGTFDQTVTVPADTELGDHTIMVTASGPGIVTTTKQQAITVTAVPATTGSSGAGKSDVTTTKPTATHGAGVGDPGTGIAPNILTRALTPIADVAVHPNKIISAFEIGLVLLLLAVLPAHLLNATIAEQSDRFERRFPKVHSPRWLTALVGWFRSAPVVGGIVVTLATAILFGFADPKFGFTLASLRLILACGIALFLVGYVANALTGVVARVQWNIVAAVSTRPYGLILTIVGVLISRLLHFSPGFLIGLILGLTIQGKSAAGFAWRTVVLRSSIVLIMAIAAWIGYSTLTLGGNEGGTFGSALLVETLVAITTEGVVALLVELLPLRFLEGERVYAHSKVLWGIFYVLTLVVFVLAVVPWEGNWDALGSSLWIWIVVLVAFALVCVGVYVYFRRFAKPLDEEAGDEKVALGESVASDHS